MAVIVALRRVCVIATSFWYAHFLADSRHRAWFLLGSLVSTRSPVYIVLEDAFLNTAVGEDHLTETMLHTFVPLSQVAATVHPVHLTITVPLIFLVLSLIHVSTRPLEYACSMLHVIAVVTLEGCNVRLATLAPLALPVLKTIFELSFVHTTVFPSILPVAVRATILVLPYEHISICEYVCPVPVL